MSEALPSIFDAASRKRLCERIEAITHQSQRAWGTMTPAQTLAHCQVPLKVALGEQHLPRTWVGRLFGWMAKKMITTPAPFKRDMPTDPRFVVDGNRDLEQERGELVRLVNRLGEGGPQALIDGPHPFFGKMTAQQWDTLMVKHLDHHLRQFSS